MSCTSDLMFEKTDQSLLYTESLTPFCLTSGGHQAPTYMTDLTASIIFLGFGKYSSTYGAE